MKFLRKIFNRLHPSSSDQKRIAYRWYDETSTARPLSGWRPPGWVASLERFNTKARKFTYQAYAKGGVWDVMINSFDPGWPGPNARAYGPQQGGDFECAIRCEFPGIEVFHMPLDDMYMTFYETGVCPRPGCGENNPRYTECCLKCNWPNHGFICQACGAWVALSPNSKVDRFPLCCPLHANLRK